MLTIGDFGGRFGRRDFLRVGSLALGGMALPSVASAAPALSAALRGKSVVFLFMYGGPSQFETFDPKMTAPEGIRTLTGEIPTAIPGVTFGSSFPKLARLADHMAIVRSFAPSPADANHGVRPVICPETFNGSLGSAYASVVGASNPETGMPTNAILYPRAVDPAAKAADFGSDKLASPGPFGQSAAPFAPGGGGNLQRDMKLTLPLERLEDRRALLASFDAEQQRIDRAQREGIDAARAQAFRVLLRGAGEAFDLSQEDPRTIARYDTAPLVDISTLDSKLLHYRDYIHHAQTLGKLLLLARRLCERGAGFVTVTTNFVWDMHADDASKNTNIVKGMNHVGGPFDHAVSVFLEDLAERGLSDQVLLVCCGEMGRTPRVNKGGGRDHWGHLGSLMLSGGGLKMGQVIGHSSRTGSEPTSDPVTIKHLVSSVMHTLFDVGQLRLIRSVGREVMQMASEEPIPGLHG